MASRAFSYNRSEEILNKIKRSDSEYYYQRVINNFYLNDKKATLKYIHLIENSFEDNIPKRILATIPLIKNEISFWKDDYNDLADISREMLKSKNRLTSGIDKELVRNQNEIQKRLDKIIDDIENNKKKKDKKEKEIQISSPNKNPLEQSQIINDSGKGLVDNKKLKQAIADWGKLPARQQAEVLQDITKGMSNRHRELIENYFRNLGKIK